MDLGNYKILVLLIAVIGKEAESSRPKAEVHTSRTAKNLTKNVGQSWLFSV